MKVEQWHGGDFLRAAHEIEPASRGPARVSHCLLVLDAATRENNSVHTQEVDLDHAVCLNDGQGGVVLPPEYDRWALAPAAVRLLVGVGALAGVCLGDEAAVLEPEPKRVFDDHGGVHRAEDDVAGRLVADGAVDGVLPGAHGGDLRADVYEVHHGRISDVDGEGTAAAFATAISSQDARATLNTGRG